MKSEIHFSKDNPVPELLLLHVRIERFLLVTARCRCLENVEKSSENLLGVRDFCDKC